MWHQWSAYWFTFPQLDRNSDVFSGFSDAYRIASLPYRKDSGQLKPTQKKPDQGAKSSGQGYSKDNSSNNIRPGIVVLMATQSILSSISYVMSAASSSFIQRVRRLWLGNTCALYAQKALVLISRLALWRMWIYNLKFNFSSTRVWVFMWVDCLLTSMRKISVSAHLKISHPSHIPSFWITATKLF